MIHIAASRLVADDLSVAHAAGCDSLIANHVSAGWGVSSSEGPTVVSAACSAATNVWIVQIASDPVSGSADDFSC